MRRARLLQAIRGFFAARGVLEVETPLLMRTASGDPFLAGFAVPRRGEAADWYLQTSPEHAMKRLLAAGSGPIYQLCKAFRDGEAGRLHNPEFSLLEWYRPGFTLAELRDEVAELLAAARATLELAEIDPPRLADYGELFSRAVGLDPHLADYASLCEAVAGRVTAALAPEHPESIGRSLCLDILFSQLVQPGLQGQVFVLDYPACQAELAKLHTRPDGVQVAGRFELFIQGVELANAYEELTDADEQLARMREHEHRRRLLGMVPVAPDLRLVGALSAGMPEAAGIALGLDRLLMLLTGTGRLEEVLAFPERLA